MPSGPVVAGARPCGTLNAIRLWLFFYFMYWHVKGPLLLLLALLLAWGGWWGWRRAHHQAPPAPAPVPAAAPAVSATVTAAASAAAARQEVEAALVEAENLLQKENLAEARTLAEKVLASGQVKEFDPFWFRAAETIGKVNTLLFNSDLPAPEKKRYTIQPGDTLIGIAAKFKTTVASIERNNKLDSSRNTIYPGMAISVMPVKFSIVAIKTRFILLVYNDDKLFKLYRVGIGKQNRTPVGVFRVGSRVLRPVWTPTGSTKSVPYGSPQNVLGTRWLGLEPIENTDPGLKGFGIHGTWQPETIGTAASEGCIRLRNEEVNELFDMIPIGTKVIIRDE